MRIADTDAALNSYVNCPVSAVVASVENELRNTNIDLLLNCTLPHLSLLLYQLMGDLIMRF